MDKVVIGIICLAAGIGIGFLGANSLNRSQSGTLAPETSSSAPSEPPSLPSNHPPVTGGPNASDMSPQIAAAIKRAKDSPADFEAQMTAGDLYYQAQRFVDAAAFYEAANRLRPGDEESLVKSGNSRFDAEQYVEAASWYEKALKLRPRDANLRSDYGLTFYLREPSDIERAIREFKASLEIDPGHEMTLQNLTIAYSQSGDTAQMRATLEKLKRVNPKNPAVERFGGQ